jgi:hypothetical protein
MEESMLAIEKEQLGARLWRTGNGTPHRGAESRISCLEDTAVRKAEIEGIIRRAVSERQRSALGIITALAPYVALGVMLLLYFKTGKLPVALP